MKLISRTIQDYLYSKILRHILIIKLRLIAKGAKNVKIITLLDKKERREVNVVPDYVGFEIPNEFVIGFGLDYKEKYRNLPYIGVIKESAIV